MAECARNFKVLPERIAGLQERAGKFAGILAAFCERLSWRDLEALIAKFQVGPHGPAACQSVRICR